MGLRHYLRGCAQLQVLYIVCCKVLNHLLGDTGECGMVCGDLVDDAKHLKDLTEGAVSCNIMSVQCFNNFLFYPEHHEQLSIVPFSSTFVSEGSRFFCLASSL